MISFAFGQKIKEEIRRAADFFHFILFRPWFCLGADSFSRALTTHPTLPQAGGLFHQRS
jgi:hypothetical protein